ncbi:Protein CBG08443 [Caenorhabditis briggsae]|uniref:Protein CBG08443 n=1 Tax=Caenorhabditis briggsae TaxID=6238 RepID=A8X6K3_CAEBR|nr:Protein CBG08443 [Caenorhabditis briggsae]CAP28264.2 Protein CBG08443 [Caenorhabditis briggsae]
MNKEGRHFILEHCFPVANMDVGETKKSPVKKFFGVPWSLYIKREDEDHTFISVRVEFKKRTDWTIDYECSVDVSPNDTHKTLKNKQFRFKASHKSRVAGFKLSGMRWSSFLGPNGYVTSAGLPVKFDITIRRMRRMKAILKVFDETNIQFSNATVEVEETRFYVDKFILKTHSPFFFKQFPVQAEEGSIPSLKLHDVTSDVFQDFLELIYNESGVIQEHNVEALLVLAASLEASVVFKPCEDFLITSEMDLPEKFRLANRFNLLELGYLVIERVDSLPLLKDLLEDDISKMNQELRISLIKRFMEEPPLLHNKVASAVVVVE